MFPDHALRAAWDHHLGKPFHLRRFAGKVMLPIISRRDGDRIKIEVTVD
jgi:hypothetical protein